MKRVMPLALAVACVNAMAENSQQMEHVLVSVPIHKKVTETALPVTVLSGDELRRQASSTIGDTLASSPGLANASFGPGVGQPVIRGQAGPRVTVLQNGTNSADVANVSADHAISVEPLLADSIEVVRGPATLLYGGGAIGGVVNVVDSRIPATKQSEISGAAEYRYDSASSGNTAIARADGGLGSFSWHLDGLVRDWDDIDIPGDAAIMHSEDDPDDFETTRGYIDNTDGDTNSITAGGSMHFDGGFFGLAVNRLNNEYGIPPGAHGHEEEEDEEHAEGEAHGEEEEEEELIRLDIEQTRYDAALHLHNPFAGFDVFRGFLTYTDYEHKELEGAEVGTRFSNESWETRLELVHSQVGDLHGSLGLQARSGEFSAIGDEAYIPKTDNTEYGVFWVEDYHSGALTIEGGLRFDWTERDPEAVSEGKSDFTAFSASAAALYDLTEQWQLGLSLMRAERAPVSEELYSNVDNELPSEWVVHAATQAIELGNADLDTEVSNNADLSLTWYTEDHQVQLIGFYNDFSDYIGLLNSGLAVEETPVFFYDQEDAEFYGVEFEADFLLGNLREGDVVVEVFGDMIRGELDSGDNVPRLPPSRLGAKLTWQTEQWTIYGGVIDAADQDRPGENEEQTDGYTRWDAGVEFRTPMRQSGELVVFARFKNLTDEEIRLSTSFLREYAPEAGQSIEGGVRLML